MAARRGRITYTPQEEGERKEFVLDRIRAGFSRTEIQKRFTEKYECTTETARNWYNKTCDDLAQQSPQDRKRNKAAVVEIYHAQIAASQSDIATIQTEINKLDQITKRRDQLQTELRQDGADIKQYFGQFLKKGMMVQIL